MAYSYPRNKLIIPEPWIAQRRTTKFFVEEGHHGFCLNDMGTGKTMAALWAADFIMEKRPGTKCLILAPLSALLDVWEASIFTHFIGRRTAVVLHGDAEKRRRLLKTEADFYILNHDGVKVGAKLVREKRQSCLVFGGFVAELAALPGLDIIIADEADVYREPSSLRSRATHKLMEGRKYVWPMTGTPCPQGPMDGYGLATLMDRPIGGKVKFRNDVMYQKSFFKWENRDDWPETVFEALKPAIRFRMDECVDVPPCLTLPSERVEQTEAQQKLMRVLRREYLAHMEGGTITVANEATMRLKALQIACGMVYDENHKAHYVDAKPRLLQLNHMIEQTPGKFIIFAPFTSVVEMLYQWLTKKMGIQVEKVTGGTLPQQRAEIFNSFRQGGTSLRAIVAHPKTMSHGLTLVVANTIIWYAPTDQNVTYHQANRRIHRPGQKEHTFIRRLVSSPLEAEIYHRLEANMTMAGVLAKLVENER